VVWRHYAKIRGTRTRSSGSSAGPASATAAGCVAFSIGSETLGSISVAVNAMRLHGFCAPRLDLSHEPGLWLVLDDDKLGPICRTVEDCALVLDAIHGPDGHDRTVHDAAFNWDAGLDWKSFRVGYLKNRF